MAESLTTLEKILFLKQVHLFSRLAARDLHILAQETREVQIPRGAFVFQQGDPGDALYVIVAGHAGVTLGEGEERSIVTVLGERECFGEIAVLTHERRTATVEALTALTLLHIRRADFRTILMAHPHMAFSIFEILASRIKTTNRLVQELPLKEH